MAPAAQPSSVNGMRRTFERKPIRWMRCASSDGIMKPVQDTVMMRSMSSGFSPARSRHFSAASRPSFTACSMYSLFCFGKRARLDGVVDGENGVARVHLRVVHDAHHGFEPPLRDVED